MARMMGAAARERIPWYEYGPYGRLHPSLTLELKAGQRSREKQAWRKEVDRE